ncbi:Os11g0633550 [Oryza sativa Japonica Group]|uniref:Os11g0633550 protein n=1 Tax=Oryza sativa subsp. japonica TaxID=39947 RepID=A0A0P0Y5B7_ORYSJ|nr:Os11g0633550 [Oryza sativa Japonica Group]
MPKQECRINRIERYQESTFNREWEIWIHAQSEWMLVKLLRQRVQWPECVVVPLHFVQAESLLECSRMGGDSAYGGNPRLLGGRRRKEGR